MFDHDPFGFFDSEKVTDIRKHPDYSRTLFDTEAQAEAFLEAVADPQRDTAIDLVGKGPAKGKYRVWFVRGGV